MIHTRVNFISDEIILLPYYFRKIQNLIFHCLLMLAQDCRGSLSWSSKFDFELPFIATKFLQVVPCRCLLLTLRN